jgi:transmembrane sensor
MAMLNERAMAEAIGWHLRQAEMTDGDWPAFIDWLEQPANARAYDRVASADRLVVDAVPSVATPVAANDVDALPAGGGGRRHRWAWGGGGLAVAAALAVLAMPFTRAPASQPYWLQTAPGEHRAVALNDGTRIELNGNTRLGLDRADTRVATLERGEAVFHVSHDAGRPFAVRSGGLSVQDVGTVFDVTRSGPRLDVAVAEGSVMFQPDADRIALTAGQALSAREDTHRLVRSSMASDLVGGWRGGRLAFADETMGAVVAAVRRRYGFDIALDPGLSDRSFTGMVAMSGSADRDIPHLAALIGAKWRRKGDRWILAPESGPAL